MPDKKYEKELRVSINNSTNTIRLMDRFDGIGKKYNTRYERLIIEEVFSTIKPLCTYHLVIENSNKYIWDRPLYAGQITFTEFKTNIIHNDLSRYICEEVTEEVANQYMGTNEIFYFSKPFLLKARNSLNGQYGETTEYKAIGVYINDF